MEFLIGNIIGRLILCYLVVFGCYWLFNKFSYASAVAKTHSTRGCVIMAAIFLLPVLAQTGSYI